MTAALCAAMLAGAAAWAQAPVPSSGAGARAALPRDAAEMRRDPMGAMDIVEDGLLDAAEVKAAAAARYDVLNPAALRRLVAGGAQLRPFPREVMQAAYKSAFELYDETAAENPRFKKVYDHFRTFRDTQLQWFRVAENTYDNFVYAMQAQEQRRP